MDLSFLVDMYIPIVMVACLVIGYCIKHIEWLDSVANEYIPAIMTLIGIIIACTALGWNLDSAVSGGLTGLASTGTHQLFKQLIEKYKE